MSLFSAEIEQKHKDLVAAGSNIGNPIGTMQRLGKRGAYRDFENGSIYVFGSGNAFMITGLIRDAYRRNQLEPNPLLGYPTSDESDAGSGNGNRFNNFEHGIIFWKNNSHHAFVVAGSIYRKWAESGYDTGSLGLPIDDERPVAGDETQMLFEHGTIWQNSKYGANIVLNNQICVTNDTAFDATIRFYNPMDNAILPFSLTLWGGEIIVPANSSQNWDLPQNVAIAKVTFDGNSMANSFKIASGGQHITFNQDQRVRIINSTPRQVIARFYHASSFQRIIMLPNGEQIIGANSEILWRMPEDLIMVVVNFDAADEDVVFRGGTVTHQ